MGAFPISESVLRALDRLETILRVHLPAMLEERGGSDYPLPAPEHYVRARGALSKVWRQLNVGEVLCYIVPRTPAQVRGSYSGDGQKRTNTQTSTYQVAIVVRYRDGYPAVTRGSRPLLESEWMLIRGELYRGAITDVLTRHAPDRDAIHSIDIETFDSDIFEVPELGLFAHGTVDFSVFQDVQIRT